LIGRQATANKLIITSNRQWFHLKRGERVSQNELELKREICWQNMKFKVLENSIVKEAEQEEKDGNHIDDDDDDNDDWQSRKSHTNQLEIRESNLKSPKIDYRNSSKM
jgi:hypothetical protein